MSKEALIKKIVSKVQTAVNNVLSSGVTAEQMAPVQAELDAWTAEAIKLAPQPEPLNEPPVVKLSPDPVAQ